MDFSLRKCIFCCENEFLAANIRRAVPAFTADFEFRGHVRAFGRASRLIAALEALNIHGSQLVLLRYRSSSQIDVQYFAARAVSFRPIFQVSTTVFVYSSSRWFVHTGPVRDDNRSR